MGSFTLIGTRVLRTVLITSIVVVVMVVENRARNDARVRDAFRDVTNKLVVTFTRLVSLSSFRARFSTTVTTTAITGDDYSA